MNKKQVMVEIAGGFHSSFGSVFLSASEKVGYLNSKLKGLESSLSNVQSLKSLRQETASLSEAMEHASREVNDLRSDLTRSTLAFDAQKQKSSAYRKEVERLSLGKKEVTQELKKLRAEISAQGPVTIEQKDRLSQLRSEEQKLSAELSRSKTLLSEHTRTIKGESNALKESGQSLRQKNDRLKSAEIALASTTKAFNAQTESVKKYEDALKKAGHEVKDLTGLEVSLSKARARVERDHGLTSRSKRLRDRRDDLRSDFLTGTGEAVALGYALSRPITIAAEFKHEMEKVGAQTKATAEEMVLLEGVARKLGDQTVFSSSEAAAAQGFLAQAGFEVQDIADSLEGVLNLASAGDTGLAETAEMAPNMLAGFSLDATEMVRVSDLMTATFISTNTDLRDLAETMKYVAPVASGLGASIEEVATASGLLGNVGLQGSMAGTALRAMYQRLASPPAAGEAALKRLNVATMDANKNLRPLTEILSDLDKKLKGFGSAEKAAITKAIFGEEAAAGATELLKRAGSGQLAFETKKTKFAPIYRENKEAVLANAGAFEGLKGKDFDKKFSETFRFEPKIAKDQLDLSTVDSKEALKNLGISTVGGDKKSKTNDVLTKEISEKIANLPDAEKVDKISVLFSRNRNELRSLMIEATQGAAAFKTLTEALDKTNSASEISKRLNETAVGQWRSLQSSVEAVGISSGAIFLPSLSEVMQKISEVMLKVSGFITEYQSLVKWIGYVAAAFLVNKAAILSYKLVMWSLAGAINIATVAQKAFNLASRANVFVWLALGAAALIAAIVAIYRNSDEISLFIKNKWDEYQIYFAKFWEWIKPIISFHPLGAIIANWEPIVSYFQELYARLSPIFQTIGGFFGSKDEKALGPLLGSESTPKSSIPEIPRPSTAESRQQNYNITQKFEISIPPGEKAPERMAERMKSVMTDSFRRSNFSFADSLGF